MEIANDSLQVGGPKLHCEADEIAFRSKVEIVDGEPKLVWLRYFGMVRRKSGKIFLAKLPDRPVRGDGRGGGGALSNEELLEVLKAASENPTLAPESVLHTDSAKAYRKVGCMYRAVPGCLHSAFEGQEPYAKHRWTHTNCTHKKKPGQRVQYAPLREVTLADGSRVSCRAGTQTVDGFWASLRKAVGKTSVNTGRSQDPSREWLHKLVRCFQWRWWHHSAERFTLFGTLLQEKRAQGVFF